MTFIALPGPVKVTADCAAIVGGAVVAWFQIWGPVLSGVSAIVAITWGIVAMFFLIRNQK